MIIYVFIFVAIMIAGYFYNRGSVSDSGFSYLLYSIYIESKDLRLDYNDILKVEREVSWYRASYTRYYGYLITYRAPDNKIRSFRFYRSLPDGPKWEEFKVKLKAKNPPG